MKKWFLVLVLPLVLLMTGCFGDPVQDDILNYSNKEMKKVAELEDEAIDAYDAVSGANYTNDEDMYNALVDTVIPVYGDFIDELKSVDIETEELEGIHDIYIEGAEVQAEAFDILVDALVNQDPSLVEEANGKLAEAKDKLDEYNDKLDKLAEEHEVEWENKK